VGPEEFAAAAPVPGREDHAGDSEADVAEVVVGEDPPMYPEADALAAAVPAADAPPFWRAGVAPGVGILGESFHGIPPFLPLPLVTAPPATLAPPPAGTGATAVTGRGVGSLPPCPCEVVSGGRIVRAVSMGAGSRPGDFGRGLISLPQPRQNL